MPQTIRTRNVTKKEQSEKSAADDQQVNITASIAGKEDKQQDLPSLIRSIMREEIREVINTLQPQLNALKTDISVCSGKIGDVEDTLCKMDSRISTLEKSNELLRKENDELKEKAERLESYSRKCNIRIRGLTKDVEKGYPTKYMATLLREMFKDKVTLEPEVEVAHRVGPAGKLGSRTMIIGLQRYKVKEEIIEISKKERTFEAHGMKLRITPELMETMAKRRARFHDIRGKLWKAGVKNGIIHPATLIITFQGESKRFTDHLQAEAYWKEVIEPG